MEKPNINFKFKKLYKNAFKVNPLIDIRKPEAYMSMAITILITGILYAFYKYSSIQTLTQVIQNLLLYIGSGMIGMLGFIISGLAITGGTLSTEKVTYIKNSGKFNSLLSILFSYYYIGVVIGISLILYFITYIIISIEIKIYIYIYLITSFILSYLFLFSIFYSISLLGTCIKIFILNYDNYEYYKKEEENIDIRFNSVRIDLLTEMFLELDVIKSEEFIDELIDNINRNCEDDSKQNLINKVFEYYDIDRNE